MSEGEEGKREGSVWRERGGEEEGRGSEWRKGEERLRKRSTNKELTPRKTRPRDATASIHSVHIALPST